MLPFLSILIVLSSGQNSLDEVSFFILHLEKLLTRLLEAQNLSNLACLAREGGYNFSR